MKNSLNVLLLILVMSVNSLIAAASSSSNEYFPVGVAAHFDSNDDVGPIFFKIEQTREQHLCATIERQNFVEFCSLLDNFKIDLNALASCAGYAPIHLAINYDPETSDANAILRRLVSMPGVDVNRINAQGVTALHIAAWLGNEDAVTILL
jgi:hypothetical protein